MKSISLFIFDLDGTLIDSKKDIANCVHWTLRDLDLKQVTDEEIYSFVGNGVRPLIQKSVGEEQGPHYQNALKIFKAYYHAHLLDQTIPFPGVLETLNHFQTKKKTVLTNKPQTSTDLILEGLHMTPLFDAILGSDNEFPKKPDPTAIHHFLEKFKISPKEAVIVGDSKVDIETGKNAGILTCGVTYGFRPVSEIENAKPDFVIESISELKSLFA